jgi:iron complex transport system permease protein
VALLAVVLPALPALGRRLDGLQLGDEVARGLGLHVERARVGLLAVAIVLCGVAVAAAGPIAFLAFIAPHFARRIGGSPAPAAVLPLAAAAGALLLLSADLAGRVAFAPKEIAAGIVTSIVAAPYFLFLLRRTG